MATPVELILICLVAVALLALVARKIEEMNNMIRLVIAAGIKPEIGFETVTVGIENVRSVITGIVIQARAGLAVIGRARRHCCLVERVHLGLAPGDKSNMRSLGVRIALPEPEEYATVPSKAFKVGMSFGAILAVVIDGMHDAERLESRLVKGNRLIEILDGYEDMVEQEFTSFVSR